jgi:hypothetical protein
MRLFSKPSWAARLSVTVVVACLAILYVYNPERYGFYPRCPLYLKPG